MIITILKKTAAATMITATTTLGIAAGVAVLTPATAIAVAAPFDGHYSGCSGQYDGSYCYNLNGGVIQHLDMS